MLKLTIYWSIGFIVGIFLGFTVSRFVALHDAVFSTASVIRDALQCFVILVYLLSICCHFKNFAVRQFVSPSPSQNTFHVAANRSNDSCFFSSVASAYTSMVVLMSLCPMTDWMTFRLVSCSQSLVQKVCRRW